MDLASLDVRKFAGKVTELPLVHPVTRKPLGLYWGMIGRDSNEFQQWVFERADERAAEEATKRQRGRQAAEEFTARSFYSDQVQELGFLSRSFREQAVTAPGAPPAESKASFTLEGQEISFSTDNAEDLLQRFPWIFEQVAAGVANRGLFMPASATP